MTHTIYECIYFYAININLRLSTICKAVNSFGNKPWVTLTVRYFCITKRLKLDFKMFNSWDEKLNELVFVIRLQQKKCFNISNNCFWQWLQINRVFTSLILDGFKLQQKIFWLKIIKCCNPSSLECQTGGHISCSKCPVGSM